jgi:fatty-acyl-CoA synthase
MSDAMTLSHARGPTLPALLDETVGANLRRTVARFADRQAPVDAPTGRTWTYAEFQDNVNAIASALLQLGIEPGDRVGIWSPNTPEWTLLQYTTAQIGAMLVTINPAYRVPELEFALNQSSISHVFAASSSKTSNYVAMLDEVRDRCPALRGVVIVGSGGWQAIAASRVDHATLRRIASGLKPSDPVCIQYTSGTTGSPKGATLTHTNILNNGYFVGEGLGYTEHDRLCIPVPFYHCFGIHR